MNEVVAFDNDWVSPTGDTILDILKSRNISIATLASNLGRDVAEINSLIIGDLVLSYEIAENLSRILGASVNFWLNRDLQYRQDLIKNTIKQDSDEAISNWLKNLPISELIKNGWIENVNSVADKLSACLDFFDISSIAQWNKIYEAKLATTAFKKSETYNQDFAAVVTWLRQGEIIASKQAVGNWNLGFFIKRLSEIKSLTRLTSPAEFLPKLIEICADCGVAVVVLKAPKGCRASGATKFISPQKALLLLSCRFLSDDQFWFSFFHEAAHLILHGDKLILEEDGIDSIEESEANNFALETLFPANYQNELKDLSPDYRSVMRFARKLDISRGIVVGQLQRLGKLKHSQLNNLKVRYKWL